jgi:hypothetical protein
MISLAGVRRPGSLHHSLTHDTKEPLYITLHTASTAAVSSPQHGTARKGNIRGSSSIFNRVGVALLKLDQTRVFHLVAEQLFEIAVHYYSALHSHEIQRRPQQVDIVGAETAAETKAEGVAVYKVVRKELESVRSAFLSPSAAVFGNVDLAL